MNEKEKVDFHPTKELFIWVIQTLIYYLFNSANLAAFQPDLDAMGMK